MQVVHVEQTDQKDQRGYQSNKTSKAPGFTNKDDDNFQKAQLIDTDTKKLILQNVVQKFL